MQPTYFFPDQSEQPGQEHHLDYDACRHEADSREQTGQFCHGAAVPAASAARTGHTGQSTSRSGVA